MFFTKRNVLFRISTFILVYSIFFKYINSLKAFANNTHVVCSEESYLSCDFDTISLFDLNGSYMYKDRQVDMNL